METKRWLRMLCSSLVLPVVLFFLPGCTSIRPLAYQPPEAPLLKGPLAPNSALEIVQPLGVGQLRGAEDVALDAQGRIYSGTMDGRILRFSLSPNGEKSKIETFAQTGGRPLGLHFDGNGTLIVADAIKGLLAINQDGKIEVLSTQADGVPFRFTNDVDVASDGQMYFTDSSSVWGANESFYKPFRE